MGLEHLHSRCVLGTVTEISSGAASNSEQLVANPSVNGRARFIIECDQDVYLKMGGSTVAATTGDHLLPARPQSVVVTVDDAAHAYLAVLRVTDDGTVKCTRIDEKSPS
jgi:hypothetical protein